MLERILMNWKERYGIRDYLSRDKIFTESEIEFIIEALIEDIPDWRDERDMIPLKQELKKKWLN